MSEVLARIRVRETAGIRRFLYPLRAEVILPNQYWVDTPKMGLSASNGSMVFSEVSEFPHDAEPYPRYIYFALSLAPYEEGVYELRIQEAMASLDDPLQITFPLGQGMPGFVRNRQQRFSLLLDMDALPSEVVYDGIGHLRKPEDKCRLTCNGEKATVRPMTAIHASNEKAHVGAFVYESLIYPDGRFATTHSHITACKSWAEVNHTLEQPKPQDEIVFTLPLAITSPTLTCDFGVGGYVFGKLGEKAPEIVWRTEFGDAPHARWSVATAGRTDYIGEVDTAEAFLPQRWSHLIDSDKALAVAITKLPNDCREMTVRLTHEGDVSVAFRLGETVNGPTEFGVCYHFLNDVPAIAAATNPQSILLPPVVEVLPV